MTNAIDDRLSCTISQSSEIIDTLAGFEGVSPQDTDVNSIAVVRTDSVFVAQRFSF